MKHLITSSLQQWANCCRAASNLTTLFPCSRLPNHSGRTGIAPKKWLTILLLREACLLENLKNLEVAVEGYLARETAPTPEKIRELICNFRVITTCSVDDADAERLARQLEAKHDVTMTIGAMLTDR